MSSVWSGESNADQNDGCLPRESPSLCFTLAPFSSSGPIARTAVSSGRAKLPHSTANKSCARAETRGKLSCWARRFQRAICWAQRRPNALEKLPFFTSHRQIFAAAPRVVAVLVFREYGRNKSSPKIVRRRVATGEHAGGRRVNFTPLRATWRP